MFFFVKGGKMVYSSAMTFFKRDRKMENHFENKGGEQNIAQGPNAISKQQITGNGNIISGTGNVTVNYGVPLERYEQIKKDLDVTDALLISFFKILEQGNIPREDWGVRLPEIAFRYKDLLQRFEAVTSDDPQVKALKEQAGQAIEHGEYDRVDMLLAQAKERDRAAVARLEASLAEQQTTLEKRQLSEAASCVEQAKLQRLQYRHEKSAQYLQEAAAALPERYKTARADYLGGAGNDLNNIARYAEALSLYEQSLSIFRAIGNWKGEGMMLNNISQIYKVQGDYGKTLDYLEQSLAVFRKVGDKEGQGGVLNNIGFIYLAKGDYTKALKYFEQSLPLLKEIRNKKGEGTTLNNIGQIHKQQGDFTAALKYYNKALAIAREIKDKALESKVLNNIGQVYHAQKNYDAA
ncbi:MAG: tetratricopeptide repeat protein, partial [Candidatus Electrothrix sp. AUS1_2]|nr:tetratricopeptide repeat protein [Candidatus Electrothrix sp. AUS1_2]